MGVGESGRKNMNRRGGVIEVKPCSLTVSRELKSLLTTVWGGIGSRAETRLDPIV